MNVPTSPTQETLLAYVEGELLPAQARQVEAYLLTDPALKQQIEGMKRDLAGLRAMPQMKAPASLMKGVLEHLEGTPGARVSEESIPFAAAKDAKAHKAKVLWIYQRVALSGLAAAATIALTLGLVYFNAPPTQERVTDLPAVPIAKTPVKQPVTTEIAKTPSAPVGETQEIETKVAKVEEVAPAVEENVDDLKTMQTMASASLAEEQPGFDPMFVTDMPRSETGEMANLDSLPSEPGAEFRKMEEVAKQMQAIAVIERERAALKPSETNVADLITATGSPAPSMIGRPEMGTSLAEMTPVSSDVSDMQVRTVNLGFASVDKGQKSILDWAGNNQIRVLSSAPSWDPSIKDRVASQLKSGQAPGNVAAGTRELRLVVTQEQMQSLLDGVALSDGGATFSGGGTRTLASGSSGTSVATMVIPGSHAKVMEGPATQPADGKKLFVLQVFLGEAGR